VRTARNIAIIALLAVPFAFLPGGGNAADAIVAALTLVFLATVGFGGYQLFKQSRLTYDTLPDTDRAVLLGAVGVLVLMVVGVDEMLGGGGGDAFLWVILVASAVVAIAGVWTRAQRL
jgi:hypothetical protein